ncbi:MAG: tRNA (N6-isopentenyl adenosine(37)-C2)-methylthiotransferase MiaB [Beijerinckiaceae bacterium]|jgi:tRNA-2-methylthio-N6-dimethylallyladenosine synthase|nr:tRNA (N6-isopentenyl adenosine(37)-C2)-methylthiotransferase MiaB [Beijerinckiaceae bacterium]
MASTALADSTAEGGSSSKAAADQRAKWNVFLKSYGCQMNVYDSERMLDTLCADGYQVVSNPQDADLVVLNTCHIRERAGQKVYSELGKLRNLKNRRSNSGRPLKLAVTGCIAQAEGAEIIRRQPAVDVVIGPQSYHKISELLAQPTPRHGIVETEFPIESKFDYLPSPAGERLKSRGVSAYVTVQEGCDKFCTFCVVPYTRGGETSRPVISILDEIRNLAAAQVREVTLIGQNVNAYHGAGMSGGAASLADLLKAVADIPGIERLRYMTSHPRDMRDDLIALHADSPKIMPYLHLPVQSGSDRILDHMNRKHTAADYISIIEKVREQRPDIAVSSDFIVGFPGESEQDFRDTMALVEQVNFACAYSFKYSPRPGTPGGELDDDVTEDIKSRRLADLQALLDEQRRSFNQASIGRVVDVLFEKPGRQPGQLTGKTPYQQTLQVEAEPGLIGRICPVLLTEQRNNSICGTIVTSR